MSGKVTTALCFVGAVLSCGVLMGVMNPTNSRATTAKNRYIGASKCKNCHSSDVSGNQYAKWSEAKHAKAYETLGTEAAKKVAAAQGIDDPQTAPECLNCHTTAFGDEKNHKRGFDVKAGVQCESCHGPGEQHMKARFKAAAMEEEDAEQTRKVLPEGEIKLGITLQACLECHDVDKSETAKPFCFRTRWKKIMHLDPRKERPADYEKGLECQSKDPGGCIKGECGSPLP